jgi:hypothetical protein
MLQFGERGRGAAGMRILILVHNFLGVLILFLLNEFGVTHKYNQKKKLKLWRLPKIEDSRKRWSLSPLGPPI